MRIWSSILLSPRLFLWTRVWGGIFAVALSLTGGYLSARAMRNILIENDARHLVDHLRAEFWQHFSPEDLLEPGSPRAAAAFADLARDPTLANVEDLRALRLWTAEGKRLWSSFETTGEEAPSQAMFGKALREGSAFGLIPPGTFFAALLPEPAPLQLEAWVAVPGQSQAPPGVPPRFVIEARAESRDLPGQINAYKASIWLMSGTLGLLAAALLHLSFSLVARAHGAASRQAAQARLASKIAQSLSKDLTPDNLFRNIIQEIRQAVPCDRFVIAGVDMATGDHRILHEESDLPVPAFAAGEIRDRGEWYLKNIYPRMRPLNIPDMEEWDVSWVRRLRDAGFQSCFIMPILRESEAGHLAHLGMCWRRKGGIAPEQEELIAELAGHLGSAVRNAALFQKAEARASRLARLNVLSRQIAQTTDLRQILDGIVQAAVELLGGTISRVFLVDEESGALIPQAHAGRIPPPEAPAVTLRVGRGVIGRIAETGVPALIADVHTHPEWLFRDWVRENGLHAYVGQPLRLGGKSIGAIHCLSDKVGFFSPEDLELLGSLSSQAAIAIEKARQFEEAQQRAVRLEVAGEISKALASVLGPEELFRTIVREIRKVVPCERCVVGSLDRETRAYHTWHLESDFELPIRAEAFDDTGAWWDREVYEQKRCVNIPDISGIPHRRAARMAGAGVKSVLVMPILQDGECAAHLFLASTRAANFTRGHERLLASLSGHLGVAFRNAALYQASEDKTSRLEVTGEIARAVSSSLEPEEIFQTIAREIRRAIPCERCAIATLIPDTISPSYWYVDADVKLEYLPPGQGEEIVKTVLDLVYQGKKPHYIPDLGREGAPQGRLARAGLQSAFFVPVLQGEECVAHISISSTRPRAFTRAQQELLASIAAHVGPAIRNARLYQASEEKSARLEVTGEIARALGSSLEPEEIFQTITREIRRAIPCERCVIATAELPGPFTSYWRVDSDIEVPPPTHLEAEAIRNTAIKALYERKAPYYIPDIAKERGPGDRSVRAGLRSTLFVPVLDGSECRAHIAVSSTRSHAFTPGHRELLASIAAYVGPAIRNARLYQASDEKSTRLEVTGEIAKALSSSLEPERLFQTIVREIRKAVPCERCVIARLDLAAAAYEYFHIESDLEVPDRTAEADRVSTRWFHREVYETKQPKLVPDLSKCLDDDTMRPWSERLARAGLRSFLVIPILQAGNSIAHLGISSVRANAFSGAQISLLTSIAQHIGSAIRNARLYRTAEERASRLAVLNEVNRTISENLELEETLESIVRAVTTLIGADHARIFMPDPETRNLVLKAHHGLQPWPSGVEAHLPPGRSLTSWVFEHGEPALIPDLRSDKRWDPMPWEWVPLESLRAAACQPLTEGGKPIGVILALAEKRGAFSGEDLALLGGLAAQASIAVEKAVHFSKARERAVRLSTLNQLNQKIIDAYSLDEILNALLQSSAELFRVGHTHIFLFDEAAGRLTLRACHGNVPMRDGRPITLAPGEGVGGQVFASGQPVNLPDVAKEPLWIALEWSRQAGLRSMLSQPLTQRGRTIGVINCLSDKVGFFSGEDLDLLGALASQAAIAIEKTTLLTQAQGRAARLELTGEIAKALNSSLEPEQIFRIIVREIRRVVPCERCVIARVVPETKEYVYYHTESDLPVPKRAPHTDRISGGWFYREVYETGRPKYVPDLAERSDPDMTPWSERLVRAGLRSLLVIPILQAEGCTAHLSLSSVRTDAFSGAQISLLTSIAQHVGSAIRNASLFRTAEQRASRLLVLNQLSQHITENLALHDTLGNIVRAACDLLQAVHARIFLIEEGTNRLVLRAHHGDVPGPTPQEHSFAVGEGLVGRVAESGEPIVVPDITARHIPMMGEWARANNINSYITRLSRNRPNHI
ncbi:MAG: GAF domain-containing protein, partial [Nitrospinota bacterium]